MLENEMNSTFENVNVSICYIKATETSSATAIQRQTRSLINGEKCSLCADLQNQNE